MASKRHPRKCNTKCVVLRALTPSQLRSHGQKHCKSHTSLLGNDGDSHRYTSTRPSVRRTEQRTAVILSVARSRDMDSQTLRCVCFTGSVLQPRREARSEEGQLPKSTPLPRWKSRNFFSPSYRFTNTLTPQLSVMRVTVIILKHPN